MARASTISASPAAFRTWTLGLAGLAAAAFFAPSAASAAECVNGYQTLPNQVILRCDAGPAGSFALQRETAAPKPAVTHGRRLMAKSREECEPGMYWGFDMAESGDLLLPC